MPPVRYIRCQAGTPLSVIHKFIRNKFQLPSNIQVRINIEASPFLVTHLSKPRRFRVSGHEEDRLSRCGVRQSKAMATMPFR